MKNKLIWWNYSIKTFLRRGFNKIFRTVGIKYAFDCKIKNREILSADAVQTEIIRIIEKGEPALVARFGGNEALCTAEYLGITYGAKKSFKKKTLDYIHFNAGVFPKGKEMAMRFGKISIEAANKVDILAWWSSPMQDYLVERCCPPEIILSTLGDIEPYYSKTPWTAALRGKKVLVIHPFKDSIESQYLRRDKLFENQDVLPEFDLKVLRAVQTIAGEKDERFSDWEEALDYMHREAMKIDFDVAIIGCGAYGMPLAAKLKDSGKIAIHLGGATQILFGIKGSRWDHHPISRLYNEYWVRPSEAEKPNGAKKIEGACYW